MEPPRALQELDLDALVGRSVEQARRIVADAGGTLRAVPPGGAVTLDYRADRVTVLVVDDEVIENHGIG